jgi:RNA-directed DNA polymerase
VRLIQKWLAAGVLENGTWTPSETGTVQGGSISPLLANLYLHYVFDLWIHRWRRTRARDEMIVVRYADDFIVGFVRKEDADRFLVELRERLAKFRLELHPDKTRLIEFGIFPRARWRGGRGPKPGTFNFLGFTHMCGTSRKGTYVLRRNTISKRMQAKLLEVKVELQRRMHDPVSVQGRYLRAVVDGHCRYYGVPGNIGRIQTFRTRVIWHWCRTLRRRSQNDRLTWTRMFRLADRWLPKARITRPWPTLHGRHTQGGSRMR